MSQTFTQHGTWTEFGDMDFQNSTFTGSFYLSATDANGAVHTEVAHEVAHMAWDAVSDQPVVSFDKLTVTCS